MDSFELNKIIAAVLMVALLVIGLGKIADGIFHVKKPKNPGYQVEVENKLALGTSEATVVAEKINITTLMALGDITSGLFLSFLLLLRYLFGFSFYFK